MSGTLSVSHILNSLRLILTVRLTFYYFIPQKNLHNLHKRSNTIKRKIGSQTQGSLISEPKTLIARLLPHSSGLLFEVTPLYSRFVLFQWYLSLQMSISQYKPLYPQYFWITSVIVCFWKERNISN